MMESPESCGVAVHHAADVCKTDALRAAFRPVAEARVAASLAVNLAASAQTWQLVLAAILILTLIRQHSRWLVWSAFAAFFLAGQLCFVMWQIAMTAVTILIVSFIKFAARFYYVWTSTVRWYRGGSIARRVELRRRLRDAVSWATW